MKVGDVKAALKKAGVDGKAFMAIVGSEAATSNPVLAWIESLQASVPAISDADSSAMLAGGEEPDGSKVEELSSSNTPVAETPAVPPTSAMAPRQLSMTGVSATKAGVH